MRLPRPGDTLGDYELVSLLGEGSGGAVFLARQRSLDGREVAVKVLPSDVTTDVERARFRREARLAAELHHPNLAEIYGFGVQGPWLFIAMELIPGPTLAAVLTELARNDRDRRTRETRRRLVRYAADVAAALAALHAEGLVHRDVKPSNVILRNGELDDGIPDAPAVLVDFGLLRRQGSGTLTRPGRVLATAAYASPEQLIGARVDARTDVFSLGVTLHDLLTARQPDERAQASAGLDPIEQLEPDLDPDLCAVVSRAADPMRRWRYTDGAALEGDLVAWLAGAPVAARASPLRERLKRWIKTNAERLVHAGGLALVVATLAFALTWTLGIYSSTARARDAYTRGDVLEFRDEVQDLPAVARLLFSEPVRAAAQRVRSPAADDSVSTLLACLEGRDERGAFEVLATRLRKHGTGADHLFRHVFVARMRTRHERRLELSAPLHNAARLFHERPDTSIDDTRASEPFRRTFLELWGTNDITAPERFQLVTALSGCGTWREVDLLHAWATDQRAGSESQRLGLLCVERILRRAHRTGGLERIDYAQIVRRQAALWERFLAAHSSNGVSREHAFEPTSPWASGFANLCAALAFGQRAAGEPVALLPLLAARDGVDGLRASARDPRVAEKLAAMKPIRTTAEARSCGELCGRFGDETLTRETELRCCAASPELAEAFRTGLTRGSELRAGIDHDLAPDEATLLGATLAKVHATNLGAVRKGFTIGERELTAWVFDDAPPRLVGLARGIEATAAELTTSETGESFLKFADFGRSAVELEFGMLQRSDSALWNVRLRHVAAKRIYLPYEGSVFLTVELDGVRQHSLRIVERSTSYRTIEIPPELLPAGRHVLTLRVEPETTTTYRLTEVALVVRPDARPSRHHPDPRPAMARPRPASFETAKPCVKATPGQVGWWPLDGDLGDQMSDNAARFRGVRNGAEPSFGAAAVQSGLDLSGDWLEIPSSPALALAQREFALELWIRPDQVSGFLVHRRDGAGERELELRIGVEHGDRRLFFQTNNASLGAEQGQAIAGSTPLDRARFQHVVAQRRIRGGVATLELFLDGVREPAEVHRDGPVAADLSTPRPLSIGSMCGAPGTHPFEGVVDEIAIFDRALAPGEVAAIYAAGPAGRCR